tara:strand:+ start:40 stop:2553 length:2514 start_codon:yes stop_codon:yes gene_type:complete
MFGNEDAYGQNKIDSVTINSNDFESKILYSAKDSVYSDLKNKQIHLFNEAKIDNGEITVEAGYILIDLEKNEVYATYILDEDSAEIQHPVFSEGSEEIIASSIRYNLNTEKGYIEEMKIKQDENYLYMEIAKKHSNDEVHFKKGRFTTCDLDEPHYHFQLSKAVMIPEKRIVSGPMNLWVKGVPTPLGLPFMIIPQQEDRTHGIVFPQLIPLSAYGFGLQDLGYYFPINDRLQTTVFGTIFNRGSWGVRNVTDYATKYKYRGNINLGYQRFKSGFPDSTVSNKVTLQWKHRQDIKANPYWNFSSSVNFMSDNDSKTNLDPLNQDYFKNQFNSDINLTRSFPGKPITAGAKVRLLQNSAQTNKTISLSSPIVNVNITRFFPFKKLMMKSSGWRELFYRFGVSYSFEGQNKATFADSLLSNKHFSLIGNEFLNGINQSLSVQTTSSLFKNTWKFSPIIRYGNTMNFQQVEKSYDSNLNSTVDSLVQKFGVANTLSFTAQLNTTVYSYYRFIGKKETLLRHILTPSFAYQYVPKLSSPTTAPVGINQTSITYSPFEQSLYRVSQTSDIQLLRFSVNNTFELKRKSDKDTITGFKKTRLIDALTASGNYNLLSDGIDGKDSAALSNIRLSMRISPIKWLSFVSNANFSPYHWNDSTGATLGEYAVNYNKLGRFIQSSFSTTATFTSKESRKKLKESTSQIEKNVRDAGWNDDYNYFLLHPEFIVNYDIPWKVSLSHIYNINVNQNISDLNTDRLNQTQTLMTNGDISFTKRWKLASTINIDLEDVGVTNARFSLSRNMHCWALAFHWTPVGGNKSFLFSIRSTSSLFKDAKIDIRKPPAFL